MKKLRAALWFLVFPTLAYVLILGLMATMFALYGKYAYHPEPQWNDYEGGVHLVFRIAANEDGSIDVENAAATREIPSERLDQFGIRNKILRVESDGLIIIQTPYYEDPDRRTHQKCRCIHRFPV